MYTYTYTPSLDLFQIPDAPPMSCHTDVQAPGRQFWVAQRQTLPRSWSFFLKSRVQDSEGSFCCDSPRKWLTKCIIATIYINQWPFSLWSGADDFLRHATYATWSRFSDFRDQSRCTPKRPCYQSQMMLELRLQRWWGHSDPRLLWIWWNEMRGYLPKICPINQPQRNIFKSSVQGAIFSHGTRVRLQ